VRRTKFGHGFGRDFFISVRGVTFTNNRVSTKQSRRRRLLRNGRCNESLGQSVVDALPRQRMSWIHPLDAVPELKGLFVLTVQLKQRGTPPQVGCVRGFAFGDTLVEHEYGSAVFEAQCGGGRHRFNVDIPRIKTGCLFRRSFKILPVTLSLHDLHVHFQTGQLPARLLGQLVPLGNDPALRIPQCTAHLSRLGRQLERLLKQRDSCFRIPVRERVLALLESRNRGDANFVWSHGPLHQIVKVACRMAHG
jgi:hypothetical protein